MDNLSKQIKANERIQQWDREGKILPSYVPRNGGPFIARLLNMHHDSNTFCDDAEKTHPGIFDKISGPYGWAFMSILIINYRQRLNKKWRSKNEEKSTARLQND